ncbi:restriction endonuclease subunit S [Microscilla marina]|uniref:HsdS n=1 Tax=Microscilla marina ATCC 23134 TaxID=313606 RepID=A1ZEM8_MICM2|nr:restriction endonuclease subunit S [Microscilla marina]EAY30980.1 HsdS [Microscilla marina ATCC 23134]
MKIKKTNQPLVPTLRFPEFEEDGEWEEKRLGDITILVSKRNKDNKKLPVYSINNKEGFLPQEEQFEGVISSKRGYDISLYKIIERNTFAYNPARIDVGSIGFSGDLYNIIISSLYVCFQTEDNIDNHFLWQFFNTYYFNTTVRNNVEGGIRNYLFYENFSRIPVAIPKKLEQQKIADCLRSLDQLIVVHETRLESLNNHKKGLMQQLFPQEGEKVPRLRFPEFKGNGEWEEKELGSIAKVTTGNKDTKNKVDNGQYPFFVRSQNVERIDSYSFDGEAILTSGDGVGVGKNFHYIIGKFDFHQRVYAIYDFTEVVLGKYIFMYFSQYFYDRVMKMSAKNSVDSVRKAMITEMPIKFPSPKEQQKIADCLSSLDTLIAAEAQKIGALGKHKKGLMQQLFPEINR